MRLQVLKAATLNIMAFWYIAQCSLVEVGRRFRCVYCLHCHDAISQEALMLITIFNIASVN
jgi:hypothetical protein